MKQFIRPSIKSLTAYNSARHENQEGILLDANENPFDQTTYDLDLNRYPDPNQRMLKEKLSKKLSIAEDQLTITSGSDEAFDILFKTFVNAKDEVIAPIPTYGMYKVLADIFAATFITTRMNEAYQPMVEDVKTAVTDRTKLILLCHPNNPMGNLIDRDKIIEILNIGIPTVIDEAYIDFVLRDTTQDLLGSYPNLIITRTFSKAYGLAGLRCGYMMASTYLTTLFNAVKMPYNVNSVTLNIVSKQLDETNESYFDYLSYAKEDLFLYLNRNNCVDAVYPSVTNFVTFTSPYADELYTTLKSDHIIIRRMRSIPNGLRITIGTETEMAAMYLLFDTFTKEKNYA